MAETAKWYVVHTYSGYENTVKATIEMLQRLPEDAIPIIGDYAEQIASALKEGQEK